MTAPKIGQTATDPALLGRRDAHHIACVLVKSASPHPLDPGEAVRFTDASRTAVTEADWNNRHAIVDPFIAGVPNGGLFWVLLSPELVSGLRHDFAIADPEPLREEEYEPHFADDDGCSGSCGDRD